MKRLLLPILSLLLIAGSASAQCSNSFYRLQEGSEFEMTTYNKKDKPQGRIVNLISQVQEKAGAYEATFSSKIYDDKDKMVTEGDYVVICEGDKLKIDMQRLTASMEQLAAYDQMEVEAEGSFLELPSSLEVGQTLPDGHTTMKIKMGEGNMAMSTMDLDVINRKVTAKESLTTPAGTFECYKITYDTDINMKIMGFANKSTFSSAEWVSEGVGVVKSESYDKKGNLNSYSLLTAYKE